MTNSMMSRFSRALGYDSATEQEAEKYRLRVTAGASYDENDHQLVDVNSETPVFVENEFVRAKIIVRVRGFRGVPSRSPSTSEYFNRPTHEKDQYSLAFSFVPKQDLPSLDTVWGNDLDHPVRDRIPPGFNTAFRIVKDFIDPGLSCDVYADEPWLYGHSLSSWFTFRIGDKIDEDQDFPAPNVVSEGSDGSGEKVRGQLQMPEDSEKRRKFFLDANNRKSLVFEKGRLYQGDFYNPYIDFGNFSLKLPGFSLKVLKYIGEKTHCLRYVFKNRETGELYFNVNFTLLWGEQLEKALREEGVRTSTGTEADGDRSSTIDDDADLPQSKASLDYHSMSSDSEKYQPVPKARRAAPAANAKRARGQRESTQDTTNDQITDEVVKTMLRSQTSTAWAYKVAGIKG